MFIERHPFPAQFGFVFFQQRVGLFQFVEAGDHGVHDLDVALGAGAEDGAELGAKDVALLQGNANGAPAQEGVELGRHLHVGQELVAPGVQGADDHGAGLQDGGRLPVGLVLLLFVGQAIAFEKEVFGAEQADALGAIGGDLLDIGGLLDVGVQRDAVAVQGNGRFGQEVVQALPPGGLLEHELPIFAQGLVGGADDEQTVMAIEQDRLARG